MVPPVWLTKVYPEGNWSVTTTPVALLGPSLDTITVNTTSVPATACTLFTDFVSDKSIKGVGVVLAVEESSPIPSFTVEFGSNWSLAVTSASFLYSFKAPVAAFTLTTISKNSVFPFKTLPESVHSPEVEL